MNLYVYIELQRAESLTIIRQNRANISLGSLVIKLCSQFITNLLLTLKVKNSENHSALCEITGKSKIGSFLAQMATPLANGPVSCTVSGT